jgi:hypothetical protein
MAEKKQELEKRLQDVTGQLGSAKKPPKKGKHFRPYMCSVPHARCDGVCKGRENISITFRL